jgi:hypothetical protein
LRQTEAHLKPDGLTKANKREKYKKFIKPLYKSMQKDKVSYEVARIEAASPASSRDQLRNQDRILIQINNNRNLLTLLILMQDITYYLAL